MIYDNGTVKQQASAMQAMAEKASRMDAIENKQRMKSAYEQGASVAQKQVEPVIKGLAEQNNAIMQERDYLLAQNRGLADYLNTTQGM